jgi:hypothetical protein
MADGLLSGLTNWVDQRKQAAKASVGLLADNPQEWLAQTTARYLPTKEEEQQYRAVKQAGGDITQTPYYQKIFDLAQFQSSLKPLSKTQFQVANEVAQKNATEMLGLPPDNTAMDRAKALGFGDDVYHGTTKSFDAFDMSKLGSSGSDALEGVFTVTNPKVANEFIWAKGSNEGGNVMPLRLRTSDPVKSSTVLDGTTGSAAAKILKQAKRAGYDRVDFPTNMLGSQGTTQVVFDPSRIRSRFAAFDPARVNETDLLASGIPIGLLGTTQVELPKKQEKKPKK